MRKRSRLFIDTSFSLKTNAGIALKYLQSEDMNSRDGIKVALACLFAPLGYAFNGASINEVKAKCSQSRTTFETYMKLALDRADLNNQESVDQQRSDDNNVQANQSHDHNVQDFSSQDKFTDSDLSLPKNKINFDMEAL